MNDYGIYVLNGGDGSANIQLCINEDYACFLDNFHQKEEPSYSESTYTSIKKQLPYLKTPEQDFLDYVVLGNGVSGIGEEIYEQYLQNVNFTIENFIKKDSYVYFDFNGVNVHLFDYYDNLSVETITGHINNFIKSKK
jgi:hypothetical protein